MLLLPLAALAQPRIVVDPDHPELDTLDFGATLVGNPIVRGLYLINASSDTVLIPGPVRPYFSIERMPEQDSAVYDFVDFEQAEESFPVVVPPGGERLLRLRFRASSGLYPFGLKIARLSISLRYTDTARSAATGSFTLKGFKVTVAAELPTAFPADSVFVGAAKSLQIPLRIRLQPDSAMRVDTTVPLRFAIRYLSFPPGSELEVDTLTALPVRSGEIPLSLRYRPENPGPDTIELRLFYRPFPTALEESSTAVLITGFGVVHSLRWDAEELSPGVVRRGDTLDFGRVRLGNQASATIRLRNEGNYRFHAADTLVPLSVPIVPGAFSIEPRPFPAEGLVPAGEVLLRVDFRPPEAGFTEVAYVLRSDIGKRIEGAPPEARQWYLVLRGTGIGARLHVEPATVTLRLLWSSNCPREKEYALRLSNTGTDLLQIDSLWFSRGTAFRLPGIALPIVLNPGEEIVQRLTASPPEVGYFADTLFIRSTTPGVPIRAVPLELWALPPTTVTVQVPQGLRAKPGSLVWMVLHADSIPEGAQVCTLELGYDPSLLRWEALRTEGTALEGAEILSVGEERPGVFRLHAVQPYGFARSSSVVMLGFRAFLGQRRQTEIALRTMQLGDTDCPDFWSIARRNGQLILDSVCGLESKLLPEGTLQLEVVPNPSAGELTLLYEVPTTGEVELDLFNTLGVRVQTLLREWVSAGTHRYRWTPEGLPPGQYFCRLRFGDLTVVRPVFLSR
jgi:hypothetical protein